MSFETQYAKALDDVIHYAQTELKLNNELVQSVLEFVDLDTFAQIYSNAASYPDCSILENHTYQMTAFIGYLRGVRECLDALSYALRYSLMEQPDEDFFGLLNE